MEAAQIAEDHAPEKNFFRKGPQNHNGNGHGGKLRADQAADIIVIGAGR